MARPGRCCSSSAQQGPRVGVARGSRPGSAASPVAVSCPCEGTVPVEVAAGGAQPVAPAAAGAQEPCSSPRGEGQAFWESASRDLLAGALGTRLIAKRSTESLAFSGDGPGTGRPGLRRPTAFSEAVLSGSGAHAPGPLADGPETGLQDPAASVSEGAGARLACPLPSRCPQLRCLRVAVPAGPAVFVFLRVGAGLSARRCLFPLQVRLGW